MIGRLANQVLAGVNYLLTIAVSAIVIVVAIVAFRPLVEEGEAPPTTTTTTSPPRQVTTPAALPPALPTTTVASPTRCVRQPPRPDDQTRVFRLYFMCGAGSGRIAAWVYRAVDNEGGLLTRTVQELVTGPDASERSDGFRSLFTAATAGSMLSVTRSDGDVVVDLRDLGPLPSLTSATEGDEFLASLNNTLFQHDVVGSVEYRIEGSCERFWEYFGRDTCTTVTRADWEASELAILP